LTNLNVEIKHKASERMSPRLVSLLHEDRTFSILRSITSYIWLSSLRPLLSAHNAMSAIPLRLIATARSGDKGNHANLGVVAFRAAGFEYLAAELTCDHIAAHFTGLSISHIERFELPRVGALNFVLYDALAGGASLSLRLDTQGKLIGPAALNILLPEPANLPDMLEADATPLGV
jgi:hypothetical protein